MKNLILVVSIFALGLCQLNAQTVNPVNATESNTVVNPNAPKAKWDKTVSDFGEIEQGIPKEAQFKLTN